ncbi:hypothetical protein ACXR0O_28590 [Verrucomicrobiota bacterium sgz303538]
MESRWPQSFFGRFAMASLLAGILLFCVVPQVSATRCLSVQQENAGCCESLEAGLTNCAGCCEAKTPTATPITWIRIHDLSPALSPEEISIHADLLDDCFPTRIVRPSEPALALSFAELVLQESLLSHAPPAEVS